MLELDLLLIPFCEDVYANLPGPEQADFELLLEQEDPEMLTWFSEKAVPDNPRLAALVRKILDRVQPPS